MKRVTGIGGVFFKAKDTKKLMDWYGKHLGVPVEDYGGVNFQWREKDNAERIGCTVFSPFKEDTDYFDPSEKPFMVNFRVDDLDALLAALREEGVQVIDKVEEHEYGKFGWIVDPEGNKLELWQPPDVEDPFGADS